MDSPSVSDLFLEQIWTKILPKQYVIPSITLKLSRQDIDFLTDDDTNPNPLIFSLQQQVKKAIEDFDGKVFVKFANRSGKDSSSLERKVTSVKNLIMLVKMSEFLTEGLCEQIQGSEMVLRQYNELFEKQIYQFRAYSIGGRLVGICQKNPSFILGSFTVNQLSKIKELNDIIYTKICELQPKPLTKKPEFVFDCYCNPSGHSIFIFSIEPFHIHALSLFTEEQLRLHYEKGKETPKIKMIEHESQLKQIDLSLYRSGRELIESANAKEWAQFLEGRGNEE